MLVLSRKSNEGIVIGHDIEVVVLEVRGKIVRLGVKAPREVSVVRTELVRDAKPTGKSVPPEPMNRLSQSDTARSASDQLLHHFCERRRQWRTSDFMRVVDPAVMAPDSEPVSVVGLG